MNTLEELLNNRLIVKSVDRDKYYKIKDEANNYKKLFQEKLGYNLIINPYTIKLEKLPGKAEPSMGILEFKDKMEYGLFCVILMFLEEKSAEEQFVLSQLTEYIQLNYSMEKLDWTSFTTRKSLVTVIKFCTKNNFFKVNDGDEDAFTKYIDTEVLYEATGVSRYFVRNFTREIMDYTNISDFDKSEWFDMDEDRGAVRRHRVYRKLIMSMGVYKQEQTKIEFKDEDFDYIRKNRHTIENDFDEMLNCDLHIHKTSAFLVVREDANVGRCFPENNNMSDVVLLLNSLILEDLKSSKLNISFDETITIDKDKFDEYVEICKETYEHLWGKTYRDKTNTLLIKEVLNYMISFGFIEIEDEKIKFQPIIGKLVGKYRKEEQNV